MSASEKELEEMVGSPFDGYMNSMESRGIYLSGPIRCVDDDGRNWRNELIDDHPDFHFNNPLDNFDPETHDILNDPIQLNPDSDKQQVLPSEYVLEDKIMMSSSDVVFVGLPNEISRGTMMEVMWAYTRNIPVFVWVIDGQEESGWIYEHAEFMSENRDEVMNEVRQWLAM